MYNIFDNLKNILQSNPKSEKLSDFEIISGKSLEEELILSTLEKKIVGYLLIIEQLNTYKNDLDTIKINCGMKIINDLGVSNFISEKLFFTKLFMRDYQSKYDNQYAINSHLKVSMLYKHFASDNLKNDIDFNKTIINLDGKNISGMNKKIRSNIPLMRFAIENDTSTNVKSFLSAQGKAISDPKLALLYFKKLKQNSDNFYAKKIYTDIFEKNADGDFPSTLFKGNVQNEWLKDNKFLAGIAKLNCNFIPYITSGKISLTSDYNQNVKRK